jgi:lysozyme family protein
MYSEKFLKAFKYVMFYEVGYVNDPIDPGGETKHGISKRSYPNLNIKDLTHEQAKQIYFVDFWSKAKCEQIENDDVAVKFFDSCVNVGISQAVKLMQRALRSAGKEVAEDGIIGPATLKAVNEADSTDLLAAFRSEAAGYYRLIVAKTPTRQRFINGWLNRAYA